MRRILSFHIVSQISYMVMGLGLGSLILVLAIPLLGSSRYLEK